MCCHVRMAEKPSKLAVLCYPNIALIEALVCNPLVHRRLCKDDRCVVLLGCLKNRRKGPFCAILTLHLLRLFSAIRWFIEYYAEAANLRPC